MKYPVLRVDTRKIIGNLEKIAAQCAKRSISVWSVTKGLSCPPELASLIEETNVAAIADSRLDNLTRLWQNGIKKPLALIRIPMLSELETLVEHVEYSVVSEIATLDEIAKICKAKKKEHRVLLMVDMGDLREGFLPAEAEKAAEWIARQRGPLFVSGVGVNFACASGLIPTKELLRQFVAFGEELERLCERTLDLFSGGATTRSLLSLGGDFLPQRVNNLRVGEGFLLGTDSGAARDIPWLEQDTMVIEAEVVEVRRKPSKPAGETGVDAFGGVPVFRDRGERLRAILALGKQDTHISGLVPLDEGIEIITASSDHLLVDAEECPAPPRVGQILRFRPDYPAMLGASTSPYVRKEYILD